MMDLKCIPAQLKTNALWCGWRYETRSGKKTKVPKNLKTGSNARTSLSSTFCDFDTALLEQSRYDGVGILLQERMVGIDMDHCIENGVVAGWAREVVEHFPDSYVEISPSGTGLRIFTIMPKGFSYDKSQYYMKKGNLEIYPAGYTNRFLTVTGNQYQAGGVVEDAAGLDWVLNTHMVRKKAKESRSEDLEIQSEEPAGVSYFTDEELLRVAMNAADSGKFKKLWDGDRSMHLDPNTGEPDCSVSDMALVEKLLFYSSGDIEQTDRLFRQSGLYREKWDEKRGAQTYGQLTIQETLKRMNKFFSPVRSSAEIDFNDELRRLIDLNPENTKKYPYTELGAGRLFADFYRDVLRFVPERDSWFYFNGTIWKKDLKSLTARYLCIEFSHLLKLYLTQMQSGPKREKFRKYTLRWDKHQFRNNVLKDAQTFYPISFEKFDTDQEVFNCINGTLHLDTGEFTEHSAEDLLTMKADVLYDPEAKAPRWNKFIEEVMQGDKEKAIFLQKVLGYSLSGSTEFECFFILYGSTTRNGKGTLCESVLRLFGDYGTASSPDVLATKWHANSSAPNEDIARLAGKRLVIMPEPRKNLHLNSALAKTLTGNDTITARFLNENSFTYSPQFKIVMNTNHLPVITDPTIFASKRVFVINFDRHFEEYEQDRDLKKFFEEPENRSAILNWLLEGYRLLKKEGLNAPQSVRDTVTQFERDSDRIGQFLMERTEKGEAYEVKTQELYSAYNQWCQQNGYHAENQKNFKARVSQEFDIEKRRPRNGKMTTNLFNGLQLLSESEEFLAL